MSFVERKNRRWTEARHALHVEIATATEMAAADLRDYIAAALDAGTHGLHSDTRALAESLYVKTTGRDDYETALNAARSAFLANPSRYHGTPVSDKTAANFEKLVAPKSQPVSDSPDASVALVATMLAYGWRWEFSDDKRPWMLPPALEWAETRMKSFYQGLRLSL